MTLGGAVMSDHLVLAVGMPYPRSSPSQNPNLCKSLYMYIALGGYGPRRGVSLSSDNSDKVMLMGMFDIGRVILCVATKE